MEPLTDKDGEIRDLGDDKEFWERAKLYNAASDASKQQRDLERIDAEMAGACTSLARKAMTEECIQHAYQMVLRATNEGRHSTTVLVKPFAAAAVQRHLLAQGFRVWPYLRSDSLLEVDWGPKPSAWQERINYVKRRHATAFNILSTFLIPVLVGVAFVLLVRLRH